MATMTKSRKSSKPSKPALVATLVMSLDHQCYGVTLNRGVQDPTVTASWRLEKKSDSDAIYDVTLHAHGGISCTCPDWEARHRDYNTAGCKHVRGLVTLGLLPEPRTVPVPVEAPAVEPAPCCSPVEPAPCSACLDASAVADRHETGPEADEAPVGHDEPAVEPEPETGDHPALPAEDPEGDAYDADADGDDGDVWPDDAIIGLGPEAEPITPFMGKPVGPLSAGIFGRLPIGPDDFDRGWKDGFDAGRRSADAEVAELELENARLRAELEDLRAELLHSV